MNRFVPHQSYFDWLKKLGVLTNALLYVSAIIGLFRILLDFLNAESVGIKLVLDSSLTGIAVIYLVLDATQAYIFYKAECCRKLDFIDNSLSTNFSKENSIGYYSNDEIRAGIYKMGVNGFENSFFTMSITEKMLIRDCIKVFVIFILFVVLSLISVREIISFFLQLAFIINIIFRTFKLLVLNIRVNAIFFDYKETFTTTVDSQLTNKIIKNVVFYEKVLSWAGITLDDKIFHKLNPALSEKWEIIKQNHCKGNN